MNEGSFHLADSTEAYVALPSVPAYQLGTSDFTVEAWVKTYSGGPVLGILATENSPGFYLLLNAGSIELNTQDGTSYAKGFVSGVSVCDGMWHHVAAVRSGTNILAYLDTVPTPMDESTDGNPPLNINSSNRITLGAVDSDSISNQHFDGLLSEVRLWNEARTAEQVSNDANFRVQEVNLKDSMIGYWSGIFGSTLDFSGTRNTGTTHGQILGFGDAPPMAGPNGETLFYVYYGIYSLEVESSSDNTWSPYGQVALTSTRYVVLNNSTILEGAKFSGERLKWSSSRGGNPSTGNLKFKIDSSDTTYWPTRQLGELCEGTIQPKDSSSPVNVRGTATPKRIGCGLVLNVGTGLVLDNNSGMAVVSPKSPAVPGHFCRYEGGKVFDMMDQKALQVHSAGTGHSVSFQDPDPTQNDLQSFEFNDSGNITLKSAAPSVVLGVNGSNSLETVPLSAADDTQKWLGLSDSQVLWNDLAYYAVLNGDSSNLTVTTKVDGNPKQSWFTFRHAVICESNALALTVSGGPAPGVPLSLAQWSSTNVNQEFRIDGGFLTHQQSGLVVLAQGDVSNGATLVLGDKASNKRTPGSQWSISANGPIFNTTMDCQTNGVVENDGEMDDTKVTYTVAITTSTAWFSGTSDRVEVQFVSRRANNRQESTEYFILNKREHTPPGTPFQSGRTDVFKIEAKKIGRVDAISILYSRDSWFWRSRWVLDHISVRQSDYPHGSAWISTSQDYGPFPYVVGGWEYFILRLYNQPMDATMYLDWDLAQDNIGNTCDWDHTWIRVKNADDPPVVTYFDCAGGHEGGTVLGAITARCIRNEVVLMSTGLPISPEHPLQPTYGTNRTDGVGNANVKSDGKINWDGQCHQIANRYLFACEPSTCIDNAPWIYQPNGYGIGLAAFGRYGIGFSTWCAQIGFANAPTETWNNIYSWVQLALGGERTPYLKKVLSDMLTFRDGVSLVQNPQPDGPQGVRLVKKLEDRGVSVANSATLLSLTTTKIEEMRGDDSDKFLED
ncbi:hypothetical protein V494_00976 [Pseudogymnoascus sp. VKM F-4513 (FW-928)]|nr:hypothetical protein V494_00976 [Pseudogymnoascus sp. VKM F-4513 (FW-928)]